MEDSGVKGDLNSQSLAQDVSEKNIIILSRDDSCDVLSKECAAFCPHPKNVPEAKLKNYGLTALTDIPNNLALTRLCGY